MSNESTFTAEVTYSFNSAVTGEPCVKTYKNVTKSRLKELIAIYSSLATCTPTNVKVVE